MIANKSPTLCRTDKPPPPQAEDLLIWYDKHRRAFPWRAAADNRPNPYHVWLAEVMLQQTTVATVAPYFEKFIRNYPQLADLAAADDEQVMADWAGLGYYSRARNLLKCARLLMAEYDGQLPQQEEELLKLPGIGPYTAAAIAAIAFNRPAAPVDGNIERVLARLYALTTPPPVLQTLIRDKLAALMPVERPGDFAQALMDLGSTLCSPKQPACPHCPWQQNCVAYHKGIAETLPVRPPKKARPTRSGIAYWLINRKKEVLMTRRPDKGLLGGMLAFPSTGWDKENETCLPELLPEGWTTLNGEVVHVFTHFRLSLKVQYQRAPKGFRKPAGYQWRHPDSFATAALPSLMHKVAKLANHHLTHNNNNNNLTPC